MHGRLILDENTTKVCPEFPSAWTLTRDCRCVLVTRWSEPVDGVALKV